MVGRGGHASEPFRALDPIPIACEIVQAMQTMVTRRIDVFDPAVVTVGRISAGTTNNMIPETAEIEGTIRAVSESTRTKVHDGIRRVAEGIAAAHGRRRDGRDRRRLSGHVERRNVRRFRVGVADEVIGAEKVVRLPNPIMGAEDFSYVLQQVPGSMMFLGGTPPDRNLATAPRQPLQPGLLRRGGDDHGIALYAGMALRHLAGGAGRDN